MDSFKCEECEKLPSQHYCETCQEYLCWVCDKAIHSKGKRQYHFRVMLCKTCPQVSNFMCCKCLVSFCAGCLTHHLNHDYTSISSLYPAVVYWDFSIFSPQTQNFGSTINELKKKYPKLAKLKVFGKNSKVIEKNCKDPVIEFVRSEEDMRAIFIDISLQYQYFGHFLIITDEINYCKPYLLKILANVDMQKIKVAKTNDYLTEINVEDIPNDFLNKSAAGEDKDLQDSQEKTDQLCKWILTYLKTSAEKGQISHEYTKFLKTLSDELLLPADQIKDLLKYLEDDKIIIIIEKQFTVFHRLKTVSLNVSKINCEVLSWVIASLKLDEMLPAERAILARVKEAFDFKPSQEEWSEILDICKGTQKSYRNSDTFSLFSSQIEENFRFKVKKYKDPVFNNETYLIYPIDQKWMCYDKYLKLGDVLQIKPTKQWTDFKAYFFSYFSNGNYEEKAIPGGRYGCAQFLKHFSAESLRELSVGKLNYIVQLGIDEDLLRYQKNLLVWKSCLKVGKEDDRAAKLQKIKENLVFVLKRQKEGISLAQLPGVLECYIGFHLDLQELGFAKLKDLVLSVQGVEIVKKANKHQYAIITKEI